MSINVSIALSLPVGSVSPQTMVAIAFRTLQNQSVVGRAMYANL
jgi:hypothetical protein